MAFLICHRVLPDNEHKRADNILGDGPPGPAGFRPQKQQGAKFAINARIRPQDARAIQQSQILEFATDGILQNGAFLVNGQSAGWN